MLQVVLFIGEFDMRLRWKYLGLITPFLGAIYAACSSASGGSSGTNSVPRATGGNGGFNVGSTGGAGFSVGDSGTPSQFDSIDPECKADCTDFPADPINPENIDPNLFSGAASGTGPCIIEPQDGTMFPRNWLRPRVNFFNAGSGQKYKLTFTTRAEKNPLVVYTSKIPWAMPKDIWHDLAKNVMEEDITLTVRASNGGESTVNFRIAPAEAGGTIVFWHTTQRTASLTDKSALFGFKPGDEGVVTALTPAQVQTTMLQSSGQPKQEHRTSSTAGKAICVGCHTSTPDGQAVAIVDDWAWNIAAANIDPALGPAGALPTYVTRAGMMMSQTSFMGAPSFSRDDWSAGKRRYVVSMAPRDDATPDPSNAWKFWPGVDSTTKTGKDKLIWINLASVAQVPTDMSNSTAMFQALMNGQDKLGGDLWGYIERTGDTRGAVTPNWSHDGTKVAYTSTDSTSDGRVGPTQVGATPAITESDVYVVPFGSGNGGSATGLAGASEKGVGEYYPTFSGDDQYVAFNRVAKMDGNPLYYRADAEIYVVSAGGGVAQAVAGNNPPQCTGLTTATIHNSWPKWSPYPKEVNGAKYYFLTFSSSRYTTKMIPEIINPDGSFDAAKAVPSSELYLSVMKVEGGTVTTYPAIYLWNQNYLFQTDATGAAVTDADGNPKYTTELGLNVTPAWDEFIIAKVPPVQVIIN